MKKRKSIFMMGKYFSTWKDKPVRYMLLLLVLVICPAVFAQQISGDNSVCTDETVTYTASNNNLYDWTVSGGTVIGSSNDVNQLTVKWNNSGTGQVSAQSGSNSLNLSVSVSSSPAPKIVAEQDISCIKLGSGDRFEVLVPDACLSACEHSTFTYNTPLNPGSTYTWSVTGQLTYTASLNKITIDWGQVGSGTITVTETNANGCTASNSVCVDIKKAPEASFTSIPAPVANEIKACLGQGINFIDQSMDGVNWNWDFGDGTFSNSQNPVHSYTQAGTYYVTLTVGSGLIPSFSGQISESDVKQIFFVSDVSCNCTSTFTMKVIVGAQSGPVIECISTICGSETATYSTPANCSAYHWSVTGGTISSSNANTVTVDWGTGAAGPGYLTLDVGNCAGYCPVPTTVAVSILPSEATITGDQLVCYGTFHNYSVPQIPGTTFTWSGQGAYPTSGQGTNQVQMVWVPDDYVDGNYFINVSYTNEILGCSGSAQIQVHVAPELAIYNSTFPQYCEGEVVSNFPLTLSNLFTDAPVPGNWTVIAPDGQIQVDVVTNSATFTNYSFNNGPGNYTVIANASSGIYCNSDVSATIYVNARPQAPNAIVGDLEICAGTTHSYYPVSPESGTYNWTVVGGTATIVNDNTVSVAWNATGPYSLSVVQVNQYGCESDPFTVQINSMTDIQAPVISGAESICLGGLSTYSYAGSALPGASYQWSVSPADLGNMITSPNANNVQISWSDNNQIPAVATVTLQVTSACGQVVSSSINVNLNGFTPDFVVPQLCVNTEASFSISGASYVEWNFGDGGTSTDFSASHIYTSAGSYPITLYVLDVNGCEAEVSKVADVKPSPLANITTADRREYCPEESIAVNLEALTGSGSSYTYEWFVDGNPVSFSSTNPTLVTSVGNYYAVVTNEFGCSTTSEPLNIHYVACGGGCPIVSHTADFTHDINDGTCNSVTFIPLVSANIRPVSWSYMKDDGNFYFMSNDASPTFSFDDPGYYWVRMVYRGPNSNGVPGDSADCFVDRQIFLPVVASFYSEYSCTGNSLTTHLIDQSGFFNTGEIDSYNWTIDGNPLSTLQNPDVVLAGGTYSIGLEISSSTYNVVCSVTKNIVVPVSPTAAFTSDAGNCPGSTIQFTDLSSGDSLNMWNWNFGSGIAGSGIQNPIRLITTPGTHDVTLSVTNIYGCSSTVTQSIEIGTPQNGEITANGSLVFCAGLSVTLTAPAGSNYLWSNGETTASITVNSSGAYSVTLTGSNGCPYTTAAVTVQVLQAANISINGDHSFCTPSGFSFLINSVSASNGFRTYDWSYDMAPFDQAADYTQTSDYNFGIPSLPGSYMIQVTGTDQNGCTATSDPFLVVVNQTPNSPIAQITSNNLPCEGTLNTFEVLEPQAGVTYTWTNGVVGTSIVTAQAGVYYVTADNGTGCTSKSEFPVGVAPSPDLSGFMSGCYDFCEQETPITLNGIPGFRNNWFMNGNPVDVFSLNGSIQVTQSGTYYLEVMDPFTGCSSTTDEIEITINPTPTVAISAQATTICTGDDTQLSATGADTYEWFVTSDQLSCSGNEFGNGLADLINEIAVQGDLVPGNGEVALAGNPVYDPLIGIVEPYIAIDNDIVSELYNWGTNLTYLDLRSHYTYDAYVEIKFDRTTLPGFDFATIASVQSIEADPAYANNMFGEGYFLMNVTLTNNSTVQVPGFISQRVRNGFNYISFPISTGTCTSLVSIGSGNHITVEVNNASSTYTVIGTDAETGCSGTQSITINTYNCTNNHSQFCSLTQGFYGNAKGKACATGEKGNVLIQRLLSSPFGPLVVGKPGRSLTIPSSGTNCLISRLPAGGTPSTLPPGNHSFPANCATAIPLNSQGRFNNVLLGQTITLGLNMRMNSVLSSFVIPGQFTTVAGTAGSDHLCGTPDDVQVAGSNITETVPSSVITTLYNVYGSVTVASLFDLANRALGGLSTGSATLADINQAVSAINEGFDGCRTLVNNSTNYVVNSAPQQNNSQQNGYKAEIYPNPFNQSFTINYDFDSKENLELTVTDLFGKVVYEVKLDAKRNSQEVNLSQMADGMYLVNIKLNNQIQETKRIVKNN